MATVKKAKKRAVKVKIRASEVRGILAAPPPSNSPIPWRVGRVTGGAFGRQTEDLYIFDADGKIVANMGTIRIGEEFTEELENAKLIVDAVNSY